ncbi:UNVERIFIED_CONTAM: hypothetical protein Sradi_2539800 [Sesamum radiatum]|uniref:50S ribosomal protein L31, chloroplastic n=1 Tax=Sesamum radiatum TaxID=300843 RepID=A0AAW2SKY7_SESRA
MKKGIHPQMQWISYVTQSGRLMNVMMTKIHQVGKVYHFRAKRQMAESIGQIAKFKRRYGEKTTEEPSHYPEEDYHWYVLVFQFDDLGSLLIPHLLFSYSFFCGEICSEKFIQEIE